MSSQADRPADVEGVRAEASNAEEEWWEHPDTREFHRLTGPARSWSVCVAAHSATEAHTLETCEMVREEMWFLHGRCHRLDGPAYTTTAGVQEWFVDDMHHRLDGPAGKTPDAKNLWAVRGSYVRDDADQELLDELYKTGDVTVLEAVLSVWRLTGPSVVDLVAAVRAANA